MRQWGLFQKKEDSTHRNHEADISHVCKYTSKRTWEKDEEKTFSGINQLFFARRALYCRIDFRTSKPIMSMGPEGKSVKRSKSKKAMT